MPEAALSQKWCLTGVEYQVHLGQICKELSVASVLTNPNSTDNLANRRINSVPKFDDYFLGVYEELRQKYGVQHLIVTAGCPDFLRSPSPSILFSYFDNAQLYQYHDCLEELKNSTERPLNATIRGLGDKKFSIRIYIRTIDRLSDADMHRIVSESNKVLSDYLQQKVLELRDYVVAMSLQTNDVSSFFHKATTEGLRAFFGYEAASAFYYDYQSDSLVLGATTGISRLKVGGLRRADIKYHSSSKSWVRRCFDSGKILSEWAPKGKSLSKNTNGEDVEVIRSRLFLPIDVRDGLQKRLSESYGAEAKANGRVGVLRIINTKRNGFYNPISMIDLHILEHFCEYLAVLGARYIRVLSVVHDQEKATHGFVTDLSTLKLRVQLFRYQFSQNVKAITSSGEASESARKRLVDLDGLITIFERDFFAVQDGMAFQLQTVAEFSDGVVGATGRDVPDCDKPFVDVVMRIYQSREYLSRNYGRPNAKVTFFGKPRFDERFSEMPSLKIPQRTFFLALRNLVENSIKYTKRDAQPQLDFDWSVENGTMRFDVADEGIGIDPADTASLFKEGFRARNALREATRGNGLGLCVSKRGLQAYDGDLLYLGPKSGKRGAIFRILIPTS